ncbi:phage portal protein [Amaricoccus solimangrovi]|uniref:Phage portal protein n=1 Tax=Amaricoccus solimangrovi TaxID=2589815 RepID=A0A501WFH3_9RHOB|nr:phage portal protein [Amaricoccus solimangrovi]TPE47235.1 phage portal protein [Amaricoccus solimangrovi]
MFDRLRSLLPSRPRAGAVAVGGQGAAYLAGDRTSEAMVNWHAPLRAPDAEYLRDRDQIVARARDITRNNGWAAGAAVREVDAVIGSAFRPLSKPNWRALGLDEGWARDWKEAVEAHWQLDAEDPRRYLDASRQLSISQLFGMAYRSYMIDGDAVGVIGWEEDRPVRTTLRVVDPDLLCNPMGLADDATLRGGVEIDANGASMAYHLRNAHPGTSWASTEALSWTRFAREHAWGRPIVLHYFDKHRDGQTRGVSRLAPIMEKLRMEDQYGRVELQAAVLNAILAVFVKSPMDPEAITDLLSENGGAWDAYNAERSAYYDDKGAVRMGGAKIPHLYPGEEIGVVDSARPSAQFGEFQSAVLRHIAAGTGQSYEQVAQDWSKVNYSSARAALIEIWRGLTARRANFSGGFCQPFFMAWLEEKWDAGLLPMPRRAPDFHEAWAAYARAKWIGPGKGFVDPVKEAQAAAMRVALGLSTLEDEAAELGGADLTENLAQIRREIAAMPDGCLHPMQESFAKLLGTPEQRAPEPERTPDA